MNFLHISIVWKKQVKSMEVLRPILDLASDWVGYGNTIYLLYTHEDIFVWQSRFRAVIAEEDSFLITLIADINYVGGWMPKSFWNLLDSKRSSTMIDQSLLAPDSTPSE